MFPIPAPALYLLICAAFAGFARLIYSIAYDKGFRAGDDSAMVASLARKRPPVTVELRRHNGGYVFAVGQKWTSPDAKFAPEMTSDRFETVLEAEYAAKRFWPDCQPTLNRDHG